MRTKEDANGNLLSRVSLKSSPTNTTSGLSLEILGEETGSGTSALYTYDVFNNMIGVLEGNNRVESKYNGNGQRVEKTVNGTTTRYLYEYDQVILEVDGSNTQTGRNIYGLNLLRRKDGAANLDYLYNGHGDVTNLMNGTTIAATYYYDAFGEETLEMKVNLNSQNPDALLKEFKDFGLRPIPDYQAIPAFWVTCAWWDMNNDEIIHKYHGCILGKHVMTRNIYVFITKSANEEYFLYVVH